MVFVIPCYNEEAALHVTAGVLKSKLQDLKDAGQIASDSSVVFVDDGSADKTWDVITSLHDECPDMFHGVKLAHNRGHQNALFAGLMHALHLNVDAAVSMDADLQDDPNAVDGIRIILQVGIHGDRGIDVQVQRMHQPREQRILMPSIMGELHPVEHVRALVMQGRDHIPCLVSGAVIHENDRTIGSDLTGILQILKFALQNPCGDVQCSLLVVAGNHKHHCRRLTQPGTRIVSILFVRHA